MKSLLLFPILTVAFFASSCRTVTPLNPMTMKPCCECLPEYRKPDGHCAGCGDHRVNGTK